jgi:hypothetical protein
LTLDGARQAEHLAWLRSGRDCTFGDPSALPWPAAELAAMTPLHPAVHSVHDGGLTARVMRLRSPQGDFALKQARPVCKVRNVDGQTSFLNELRRHAELAQARAQGHALPGIVAPVFGSLRQGVILSPWIEGASPDLTDPRCAQRFFEAAFALLRQGCFEWDFSPGNLIDDGERVWLFDFGYCYRFNPLSHCNSAGTGTEHPQFNVVERIEARNLFGALLDHPDPLRGFVILRSTALQACHLWLAELRDRGAAPWLLADWQQRLDGWADRLATAPEALYLEAARAAHETDLHDDLSGQSCTPRTLRRIDWLLAHTADTAQRQLLQQQRLQAQAWQHP